MVATLLVVTAARDRKAALLLAEERRLQESIHGRLGVFRTWLDARQAASRRLSDSQVFRLFVTDLSSQPAGAPPPRFLQDQLPYFRQLMNDFARQNGLLRATVMRADGRILLSSPGPALPVPQLRALLEEAPAAWKPWPSPIRTIDRDDTTFAIDLLVPLRPPQNDGRAKAAAFLVLTSPMDAVAGEFLAAALSTDADETIALIQRRGEDIAQFHWSSQGLVRHAVPPALDQHSDHSIPFDRYGTERPIYALGRPLPETPWVLYHAIDARKMLVPFYDFVVVAAGISIVVVAALAAAFAAAWWRRGRNHHRDLVALYKAQAGNFDRQRQFLQAIMSAIGDWLAVSAPDGRLTYANPAFASAFAAPDGTVIGKSWGDLAEEVGAAGGRDQDLCGLMSGTPFTPIAIDGSKHLVSIRAFDLKGEGGQPEGTIRVIRDHTDSVLDQQRRTRAMTQAIDAFIHIIERRDAFLVGHTSRLRSQVIAIGQKLGLPNDDLARLALAASLSQIGKIFIPDEILAKPERHSEAEAAVMRDHIRHAIAILDRIDFDMPIIEILGQMHERLDGSGYPHGLAGDDIGLPARILAVADVFCARTAPRSYRDRVSAGKALYYLAGNGHRYDLKVIAALSELIGDDRNNQDQRPAQPFLIDSEIWQARGCGIARTPEPADG